VALAANARFVNPEGLACHCLISQVAIPSVIAEIPSRRRTFMASFRSVGRLTTQTRGLDGKPLIGATALPGVRPAFGYSREEIA